MPSCGHPYMHISNKHQWRVSHRQQLTHCTQTTVAPGKQHTHTHTHTYIQCRCQARIKIVGYWCWGVCIGVCWCGKSLELLEERAIEMCFHSMLQSILSGFRSRINRQLKFFPKNCTFFSFWIWSKGEKKTKWERLQRPVTIRIIYSTCFLYYLNTVTAHHS